MQYSKLGLELLHLKKNVTRIGWSDSQKAFWMFHSRIWSLLRLFLSSFYWLNELFTTVRKLSSQNFQWIITSISVFSFLTWNIGVRHMHQFYYTFMLFLHNFWSLKALVPIHCKCMDKKASCTSIKCFNRRKKIIWFWEDIKASKLT